MSVFSELSQLNSLGNMQLGDLADRGTEVGCEGDRHGVAMDVDSTNSMGGISGATGSDDAGKRFGYVEDFSASGKGPDFTGSMGSFSADGDDRFAKFSSDNK